MHIRRLAAACAGAAAAAVLTTGIASADTAAEQVHPSDLGGEWHTGDTRADGTLSFTDEHGGALGAGAAVLTTPSPAAKAQLFTEAHDGTYLRDITELGYATYQVSAPTGSVALPSINMRIDLGADFGDGSDAVDAYLVYEPYQDDVFYGNAAIEPGTWQTWDAWHDGASQWWSGQIPECRQATPCTIDRLLSRYPDAVIREDDTSLRSGSTPEDADFRGAFGINQGSGNGDLVGAADALHLATADGVDVTYDFEPEVRLTGKGDCKKGGWATSTAPEFRNQGACVSYFATRR